MSLTVQVSPSIISTLPHPSEGLSKEQAEHLQQLHNNIVTCFKGFHNIGYLSSHVQASQTILDAIRASANYDGVLKTLSSMKVRLVDFDTESHAEVFMLPYCQKPDDTKLLLSHASQEAKNAALQEWSDYIYRNQPNFADLAKLAREAGAK
jgi:hypothetical protein